jgi:hypothetical protein
MDAEVTIEFSGTEAEPMYALRVTVPLPSRRTNPREITDDTADVLRLR